MVFADWFAAGDMAGAAGGRSGGGAAGRPMPGMGEAVCEVSEGGAVGLASGLMGSVVAAETGGRGVIGAGGGLSGRGGRLMRSVSRFGTSD
jgi:hypothetical protein